MSSQQAVAAERERPFWSDSDARNKTADRLCEIATEHDGVVLMIAPSVLLFAGELGSEQSSLWGHTNEGYGEAIAEALLRICGGEGEMRGLVFKLLKESDALRDKVLRALLRECLDKDSLDEQDLYQIMMSH